MNVTEAIQNKQQLIGKIATVEGILFKCAIVDDVSHHNQKDKTVYININTIAKASLELREAFNDSKLSSLHGFFMISGFTQEPYEYRISVVGQLFVSSDPDYPLELVSSREIRLYIKYAQIPKMNQFFKYAHILGVRLKDLHIPHIKQYSIDEFMDDEAMINTNTLVLVYGKISEGNSTIIFENFDNSVHLNFTRDDYPIMDRSEIFGVSIPRQSFPAFIIGKVDINRKFSEISCLVTERMSHQVLPYIWCAHQKGFLPDQLFNSNV